MNTDKSFVFDPCLSAFVGGQSFFRVLAGGGELGSFCNSGGPGAWAFGLAWVFIRMEGICAAGAMAL
jgi:hypothetical protein